MVTCARCGQENPEGFAYCGAFDIALLRVNAANIHLGAGRTDEARSLLEWAIEVRDHKGIVLGANRIQEQLAAVRN
jgi:hypothetical protein